MKTLKFLAIFCLSALAFVGCQPNNGDNDDNGGNGGKKSLILVADKSIIYDNGTDAATFTLYYDGLILTEGYEIYVGDTLLEGNTFSSTTQGTFEVWAANGTLESNTVNINVVATPPAAPAAPQDNNPSKTNFKQRILLTQFTGTTCPNCPYMINALHQVLTSATLSNKVVVAAAHLYNDNDPAYLSEAKTLDDALVVQLYPSVYANLDIASKTLATNMLFAQLTELINSYSSTALAGIAVNSEYHAKEEYIVLNATVKAKETNEFRIGAWLLEDNITGHQANNGVTPLEGVNFNNHNNVIRLADSMAANTDFSGFSLGTIEAGKTASREFAFKLKANGTGNQKYWNHDNLRVIVFISTKEGNKWLVNNVVKCPKDGSVDFEYED